MRRLKNNLDLGGICVSPFLSHNPMKSISINLDPERSSKLAQLSEATAGHTSQVDLAGQTFSVKERKISASAIAIGLLNAAIDNAHAQLPQ